ncbi:MAG: metal-dependent hydrolase [Xanthomonadales bacterium]|jgi:inner membrane protein|nr:metal-dependent hydrolase [Xanthomonadales bacterium]
MDSLSQIALGASLALALAPPEHRRRALIYGAALGTLPDLDAIVPLGGPVEDFVFHRSASHSLILLAIAAPLLWRLALRLDRALQVAPRRWLAIFVGVLLTHPLLDWFTIYGTQLFWPLDRTPYGLGSMFIIDPLYTLPLLIGIGVALATRVPTRVQAAARVGLALSCAYLALSAGLQAWVLAQANAGLRIAGLSDQRVLALPTPFNLVLWRVLSREPGGYRVAYVSLLDAAPPSDWRQYPSLDTAESALAGHLPWQRLEAFSHGWHSLRDCGGRLVFADLRMGVEPVFVFQFALAESDGAGGWRPIPAVRVTADVADGAGPVFDWMSRRIHGEAQSLSESPADFRSAACTAEG